MIKDKLLEQLTDDLAGAVLITVPKDGPPHIIRVGVPMPGALKLLGLAVTELGGQLKVKAAE